MTVLTTETTHSNSIATRNELREVIKAWQDTREFKPLDLQLIADACQPRYKAMIEEAIESGEETVCIIDLSTDEGYAFLRGWIQANGVNRTRKQSHFQRLALGFQENYDSSCTHYVLSRNGMVANAGHSGFAFALAYYPETIFYGLQGDPVTLSVKDEEGNETTQYIEVDSPEAEEYPTDSGYFYTGPHPEDDSIEIIYESAIPKYPEGLERVGEFDENGEYIQGTDNPEAREGKTATLFINASNDACLKMDDVRLEADYQDFLEMIGPYRAYLSDVLGGVMTVGEVAAVLKQWYLRTNGKDTTYGTLSKGGRLNKSEIQAWFLAAIPMLIDSITLLLVADADGKRAISTFPSWSKPEGKWKGGISLQNALCAMMVSDEAGRTKIASLLKTGKLSAPMQKMKDHIIVEARPGARGANADEIVTMLVLYGKGKKDPAELVFHKDYWSQGVDKTEENKINPWQDESTRADGWDSNALDTFDDGEESRDDEIVAAAEWAASVLGDVSMLESVSRKANAKKPGRKKRAPNKKRPTKV